MNNYLKASVFAGIATVASCAVLEVAAVDQKNRQMEEVRRMDEVLNRHKKDVTDSIDKLDLFDSTQAAERQKEYDKCTDEESKCLNEAMKSSSASYLLKKTEVCDDLIKPLPRKDQEKAREACVAVPLAIGAIPMSKLVVKALECQKKSEACYSEIKKKF